jgi:hemerythrin-like domain-containing protein/nucleotide-binding universal stress UspA family protein
LNHDNTFLAIIVVGVAMYRHLLVPIDNTDLVTVVIGQAVESAQSVGARITFIHVQPGHVAALHDDTKSVHRTTSENFSHAFAGQTLELLTKAESAARAQGVPCSSTTAISDIPHAAILSAARTEGCDLIFMALHGHRETIGMMPAPQTLEALTKTEIPVLISAAANLPAPAQAIGTIRKEHRSLATVLHAWIHMLKSAEKQSTPPDAALMKAMVHYIQSFPVEQHHTKEQEYLFCKLRERTSAVNAELDELERQHEREEQLVVDLNSLVERYAAGNATPRQIEQAVSAYATFIWEHMGREEGVVLPAAQRYLTDEDWKEINDVFSENQDPCFGSDTDAGYDRLFSRILNLSTSSPQ